MNKNIKRNPNNIIFIKYNFNKSTKEKTFLKMNSRRVQKISCKNN